MSYMPPITPEYAPSYRKEEDRKLNDENDPWIDGASRIRSASGSGREIKRAMRHVRGG